MHACDESAGTEDEAAVGRSVLEGSGPRVLVRVGVIPAKDEGPKPDGTAFRANHFKQDFFQLFVS